MISSSSTILTNEEILQGPTMPPLERLKTFSPAQFEDFTNEWAEGYLKKQALYQSVKRLAGSGDKGRDIVGYVDEKGDVWDNFQCKHYQGRLSPSIVLPDIAKFCYFAYRGEYLWPRKYCFISSVGVGPKLEKILKTPDALRRYLIDRWDIDCADKITDLERVELTAEFLEYIKKADFSIFSSISPLQIIAEHARTPWHAARFGGGLKARPKVLKPTSEIQPSEQLYVKRLFDAYSEAAGQEVHIDNLKNFSSFDSHLKNQRELYFHAESLKGFARDTLPPQSSAFEDLENEVHEGVREIVEAEFPDGFKRVNEVVKQAAVLPIVSNPLSSKIKIQDKKGICHHLANANKVRWANKKDV